MVQVLDGKAYSHQVKACLLFAEHNILFQAFVIMSRLRYSMTIFQHWIHPLWIKLFKSKNRMILDGLS